MSADSARRKPRIRKSAPTIRERQQDALTKAAEEKPKRIKKTLHRAASPVKKTRAAAKRVPVPTPVKKIARGIGRVLKWLVPSYFVNSAREVRQVTWPNRRETWRLTLAVFIFAAIFGALVAGVDKVLDLLFKNLVLK